MYSLSAERIWVRDRPLAHRAEEYDPAAFELLAHMQRAHFWYRGRHRFLLDGLSRQLGGRRELGAIDLGAGCGGWMTYLAERLPGPFSELAIADSSVEALQHAAAVLPATVERYQIDLYDLGWQARWDVVFLLDVIEHLPEDRRALEQARAALKPGGFAVITVPALDVFWSRNDELAHHQRRYSRESLGRVARAAGFEVVDARYFMFFLSPLLVLQRLGGPSRDASPEECRDYMRRTHRVPAAPVNLALEAVFSLETPVGHALRFPWGTSLYAVLR